MDVLYAYSGNSTVVFSKGAGNIVVYTNPAVAPFKLDTKGRIKEGNWLNFIRVKLKNYPVNRNMYSLVGASSGTYLIQIDLRSTQVVLKPIIVEK